MNRISSLLALGLLSLGLATSATAQTKVTQLVVQNTTGTTKISQTSSGLDISNKIIIHCPSVTNNSVTLQVPYSATALNTVLTFPNTTGTLMTTEPNQLNGDAMIAAINMSTTGLISASHLDLSGVTLGVQTVASAPGDASITVSGTLADIDLGLNLGNANNWTGVQYLPANSLQGNNLIAAINAGTNPLTGYATSSALSSLTTIVNNHTTSINTLNTNVSTLTTNLEALTTTVNALSGGSASTLSDTAMTITAHTTLTTSMLSRRSSFRIVPQNSDFNITLGNGTNPGQTLVIMNTTSAGSQKLNFSQSTNTRMASSAYSLDRRDVIMFIWSGSEWLMTSYVSNN